MTRKRPAFVALAALAIAAGPVRGQADQTGDARGVGESGLAALSDDALLGELAGRQMQGLLNFAFEANNVPAKQRAGFMAIPAILRLKDADNPPKPHERTQLIKQIAAGADRIVAGINDPKLLMEHSATLIKFGVEPEANVMEYWGETPKAQKRLAPVVAAVMKMLDKAIVTGTAARSKLEEQLTSGRNARIEKLWIDADQLVTTAEFTRAMVKYNEAMAVPATAAGNEQRRKLADEAIEFLLAYDTAESGVQAAVRNRMAKLNLAKREYGPANDLFESVSSGRIDDKTPIEPAPTPFEQYEARYFGVVAELMQGDVGRARKGLDDLVAWQRQAVPDPKAQEGLAAAADMLRYRMAMKERSKTKDPAARKAAEERAFAVLMDLNEKQPALRPIIAEQLIEAVGDTVDLKKAELLILQALVNRAVEARDAVENPGEGDPALNKQIEQGIAAAREVMARRGKDPKVTARTIAGMAIHIPLFYEKLGRKVDAVNAYLDFVEQKLGDEKNTKAAFDQAGYLLFTLTKDGGVRNDPDVSAAWERFLPVAIDQFKRTEFAFDYANRLRAKRKFAEALKYYAMVPSTDTRYDTAVYRKMATLTDLLYEVGPDKKPLLEPDERAKVLQATLETADEVRRQSLDAIARAADAKDKAFHQSRLAVVTLTQAELAASGEQPDWQKVLTTLEGFEEQSEGLDNQAALGKKVMELRVAAYMQLKQFNKAANVLIELLQKEPGGRAAGLVLGILQRLNEDYDRAKAQGNEELARGILADRANLSGFLVNWATESKDPNVAKNIYIYKVYDADTQRLYGASLEGEERTTRLRQAMAAFEALRSPENVAAYQAFVAERKKDNPQDKTDADAPDPAVTLGMALTSYDLSEWRAAATEIKRLRFSGKLGVRSRVESDDKTGEAKVVPNEQYWEAMYKYYDATRRWASAEPQDADASAELGAVQTLLRRDYVAGPDDVGGAKWTEPFDSLRKELIPDLNLDELRKTSPPASTTPDGESSPPVAQGEVK